VEAWNKVSGERNIGKITKIKFQNPFLLSLICKSISFN